MHQPWSDEELMAVLLAREVRDGEVNACGALSMIPAAGLLLARAHHAPDAEVIILGSPAYFPFGTSRQFHFLAQRGELDLFFVSGVQIDRCGNYNLHQIGPDRLRPRVRFPGGFGGGMLYYAAKRTVVFRTEHTPRTFVERVDYVSAAATTPPDVIRHGFPSKVITPLATLRMNPERRVLELESVHPPYTAAEVAAQTGFALGSLDSVAPTAPPTERELALLRGSVRESMIATGTYPDWARDHLGAA